MEQYDTFLNTVFKYIDQRYRENKRLQQLLIRCLIVANSRSSQEKAKKVTIYHYKKCIYRVLSLKVVT